MRNPARGVTELIKRFGVRKMVEVGVYQGYTATALTNTFDFDVYYLIDPWKITAGIGAGSTASLDKQAWEQMYNKVKSFFADKVYVRILRMTSEQAVEHVIDGSMDLVFIDSDHTYESCEHDIRLWLPKVKSGGVLCGDDIKTKFPGIKKAVEKHFGNTYKLSNNRIWWILK